MENYVKEPNKNRRFTFIIVTAFRIAANRTVNVILGVIGLCIRIRKDT